MIHCLLLESTADILEKSTDLIIYNIGNESSTDVEEIQKEKENSPVVN